MDHTVKCWARTCTKRLEPIESTSHFGVFCSSRCQDEYSTEQQKCRHCGLTYIEHDGTEQHRFNGR